MRALLAAVIPLSGCLIGVPPVAVSAGAGLAPTPGPTAWEGEALLGTAGNFASQRTRALDIRPGWAARSPDSNRSLAVRHGPVLGIAWYPYRQWNEADWDLETSPLTRLGIEFRAHVDLPIGSRQATPAGHLTLLGERVGFIGRSANEGDLHAGTVGEYGIGAGLDIAARPIPGDTELAVSVRLRILMPAAGAVFDQKWNPRL